MFTRHPRLAYVGAWALVAAFYTWMHAFDGTPMRWLMVFNLGHFGMWALLGLVAMPVIRRVPLRAHWRPWLFHLAFGALMTQVDITLGHWFVFRFGGDGGPTEWLKIARVAFEGCFHIALVTYFGMVAVVQGIADAKRARRHAVEAAEQRAAFDRAQLETLKSQLQPHFLFNTLHAVTSLMHYDVATAERMLHRLGDLLRRSLAESGAEFVTLRAELDFLAAYIEIEEVRFEQRLRVSWDVPAVLDDAAIPPFILQPLVENAIKHGVAPHAAGGAIVIRARVDRADLVLEVEDDAPVSNVVTTGFGIGLRNTRQRLETLYGEGRHVELVRAARGTIARIRLPGAAPARLAA